MIKHSGGILFDQFLDVREHQDFSLGPVLHSILAESRNDVTLARSSGQDDAWVLMIARLKPFIKIIKNSLLVFP